MASPTSRPAFSAIWLKEPGGHIFSFISKTAPPAKPALKYMACVPWNVACIVMSKNHLGQSLTNTSRAICLLAVL